jgi:hypothetical protein
MQLREAKKAEARRAAKADDVETRLRNEEHYQKEMAAMEQQKREKNREFTEGILHQIKDRDAQRATLSDLDRTPGPSPNDPTPDATHLERQQKRDYADALKRQISENQLRNSSPPSATNYPPDSLQANHYQENLRKQREDYYSALQSQIISRATLQNHTKSIENTQDLLLKDNLNKHHNLMYQSELQNAKSKQEEAKRLQSEMEARESNKRENLKKIKDDEVQQRLDNEQKYNRDCLDGEEMRRTRNKQFSEDLRNQIDRKKGDQERASGWERQQEERVRN